MESKSMDAIMKAYKEDQENVTLHHGDQWDLKSQTIPLQLWYA